MAKKKTAPVKNVKAAPVKKKTTPVVPVVQDWAECRSLADVESFLKFSFSRNPVFVACKGSVNWRVVHCNFLEGDVLASVTVAYSVVGFKGEVCKVHFSGHLDPLSIDEILIPTWPG